MPPKKKTTSNKKSVAKAPGSDLPTGFINVLKKETKASDMEWDDEAVVAAGVSTMDFAKVSENRSFTETGKEKSKKEKKQTKKPSFALESPVSGFV